ncbi:VaFE repeat-containing surface-anchored protein [Lactobacillus crispatus]|uniref:VaFE repeat-containing surface-anchored protein n=1 Tax=Lactobacillus crispatus TaxID=47770 RepID=UPI001431E040|nr:VaFE repeat-containing surface-anchored protein [Lactobacillus crispatus]NJJ54137.1 VaFE repeat-containing surface-anchored protein [Lactobacillus crispatus]
MKKVQDYQNSLVEEQHKGLKFLSAITMALPMFLGTTQKAFAIKHLEKVPMSSIVKDHSMGEGNFGTVTTPSGKQDTIHQGWHGANNLRFYCLQPMKLTPVLGEKEQFNHYDNGNVRAVLRCGFGANSAKTMASKIGGGIPADAKAFEFGTQCAVWKVAGSIGSVSFNQTAGGKHAKACYDYIMKHYKDATYRGDGTTTLSIHQVGTKADKTARTRHLIADVRENKKLVKKPRNMSISLKGLSVTQGGAKHTKQIKTATGFTATLNAGAKTGTITAEVPAYNTVAAVYYAGDNVHQNGVALMAVKHGTAKKTYDWSTPEKPPVTPPPAKTKVNYAQFDINKVDDENDKVFEAKFDIYQCTDDSGWDKGKFVGTITTDKNGVAKSGVLPESDFHHYIAIEHSTGKNLDVDPTPVHIDLTLPNLQQNAKVTKTKDGEHEVWAYHLTVQGPVNNHKHLHLTSEATNLEDNSKFAQPIKGPVVINEQLRLAHLVGTVKYNVKAWLVDKATGQPITIDGKQIEVEKTIGSPNNDNNDDGIEDNVSVQLKIPDASSLAGKDVVVFSHAERADKPDHWSVDHQDLNDKHETIHFSKPEIHTKAINAETNGNQLQPTDGETLTDTIYYKELIPGKTYTVKGIVMDKQSGKAVLNNGKKVEFSKTFTAENANGEVNASVTFDAHHYWDHDLVVYETLYYTGYFLTDHRDINDASETLHVTHPQMHTTLSYNTQKFVYPKTQNIAEDVVRYTYLIPGQQYTLRGKLMDQVTGLPVVQDGVPIVATVRFTPRMTNGTVTLTFKFNGMPYVGHTLVAFESLYYKGRILMEHADLNDASESIVIDHYHRGTTTIIPHVIHHGGHGGAIVVNNNNNNNNNNNSSNNNGNNNNGNNSSNNSNNGNSGNNGSNNNQGNNSGNNGSNNNQGNNSGNNGSNNNPGNNSGNNGSNNNQGNNSGSNESNNQVPVNNTETNNSGNNSNVTTGQNNSSQKNAPARHVQVQKPVKKQKKAMVAPANNNGGSNNTSSSSAPAQSNAPQQVSTGALPVPSVQESNNTGSDNGSLPQTGNAKSNIFVELIALGLVSIPALAVVEYIRRHQTAGMD